MLNPAQDHLRELPLPARLVPAHLAPGKLSSQGASGSKKPPPKPVWRVGDKVLQMKNDADKVGGAAAAAGLPLYGAAAACIARAPARALPSGAAWPAAARGAHQQLCVGASC